MAGCQGKLRCTLVSLPPRLLGKLRLSSLPCIRLSHERRKLPVIPSLYILLTFLFLLFLLSFVVTAVLLILLRSMLLLRLQGGSSNWLPR